MYAELFPVFAAGFTLIAFVYNKNNAILLSLAAALFWLMAALTCVHVTFVADFGGATTYTADGTSDIVYIFGGMSLLMFVYSAILILQASQGAMEGAER